MANKIDGNELEKAAMECFRCGETQKAQKLQEQFLEEVLQPGVDYCTCKGPCRYHGKCIECVTIHRGHEDHLPECFRTMVNRRIEAFSALTEHSL